MTSDEVIKLLRARRYAAPEWFVLEQVTPGKFSSRFIDLVAWNIWTSRGFPIDGCEIKVARNDWLRELKNPAKAEVACDFVEAYWVAAPQGVVQLAEVPAPWGFYEIVGDKVYDRKQPVRRKRVSFDVSELAAILQRVVSSWKSPEDFGRLEERHRAELQERRVKVSGELQEARTEAREALSMLESLRGFLGNSFESDAELRKRARKLHWLLEGDDDVLQQARQSLERMANVAEKSAKELRGALAAMPAVKVPAVEAAAEPAP